MQSIHSKVWQGKKLYSYVPLRQKLRMHRYNQSKMGPLLALTVDVINNKNQIFTHAQRGDCFSLPSLLKWARWGKVNKVGISSEKVKSKQKLTCNRRFNTRGPTNWERSFPICVMEIKKNHVMQMSTIQVSPNSKDEMLVWTNYHMKFCGKSFSVYIYNKRGKTVLDERSSSDKPKLKMLY